MYVLDTNAAYYLIDRTRLPAVQLARLQEKAQAGQIEFGLPPITVMELATRIVEDASSFDRIKDIAGIILDLQPKLLPDPEQRMREIVADGAVGRDAFGHWGQIVETLARAPDAASLQRGFDDYKTATRRSANVVHLSDYREAFEREFVRDMLQLARRFNPKYDEQALRRKQTRLPVTEQEALRTFVASSEWTTMFLELLAFRGSVGAVPVDDGKRAVILKKAHYFKVAYETLIVSMFCDGARPNLKRKNDYNDIHQLLYVSDFSDDFLVSDDGGAITSAGASKVLKLSALLEREAV